MTKHLLTSSSTVGPFFAPCLLRPDALRQVLAQPETAGEPIRIEGRVTDGDGAAVTDAMIEIWQANGAGRYNHPADQGNTPLDVSFAGFGRTGTDKYGVYWFETIKPGLVPFEGEKQQAPHINVTHMAGVKRPQARIVGSARALDAATKAGAGIQGTWKSKAC